MHNLYFALYLPQVHSGYPKSFKSPIDVSHLALVDLKVTLLITLVWPLNHNTYCMFPFRKERAFVILSIGNTLKEPFNS